MVLREPQSDYPPGRELESYEAEPETREGSDSQASEASSSRKEDNGAGAQNEPSCLIPGTSLRWAWDATCLSDFKKCPRYYQLKRLEGWTNETGIHLRWGSEYHKALEDYDRERACGIRHADAVHDVVRALLSRIEDWEPEPRSKSEQLKSKEHLLRSVVWYLTHFREDSAQTLILENGKPAVELNFNFEIDFSPSMPKATTAENFFLSDWPNYHLCGYLDRVVSFSGALYVMDRKSTTSTPGSYYFEQYDLSEQMTLYSLASKVLLQSPIKGVIVDVVQVAVGFSRFTRGFTYRTPDQLEEWLADLKVWLAYAETCASNLHFPMNLTSCDKYGGCEFKGICSRSPGVRERFLESEFRREEIWNPLKPR